jgi:hypothetical protein
MECDLVKLVIGFVIPLAFLMTFIWFKFEDYKNSLCPKCKTKGHIENKSGMFMQGNNYKCPTCDASWRVLDRY